MNRIEEILATWVVGGASTTSTHKDSARSKVGWTAFLVALFRAVETVRRDKEPELVDHPTVDIFDYNTGLAPLNTRVSFYLFTHQLTWSDIGTLPVLETLKRIVLAPLTSLLNYLLFTNTKTAIGRQWTVARSVYIDRHLDDFVKANVNVAGSRNGSGSSENECQCQVVILGVGLDARPFRLKELQQPSVKVFEVDFPGMLQARKELFHKDFAAIEDAKSVNNVVQCAADLSTESWSDELLASGFDSSKPTVWLMEGLVGYLTEKELDKVLEDVTTLMKRNLDENIKGKVHLIVTWLGTSSAKLKLHRSHWNSAHEVDQTVSKFGWALESLMGVITKGPTKEVRDVTVGPENVVKNKYQFFLSVHSLKSQ